MKTANVEYFFREMQGMNVQEAILYLIGIKLKLKSRRVSQMNLDWRYFLRKEKAKYPTIDEIYDRVETEEFSKFLKDRRKNDWEEDYDFFCKESHDRNLAWDYLCSCKEYTDGDKSIVCQVKDLNVFYKWLHKFYTAMDIARENYLIEEMYDNSEYTAEDYELPF